MTATVPAAGASTPGTPAATPTSVKPIPPSKLAPAAVKPAPAPPSDDQPSDDEVRAAHRKVASDLLALDKKSPLPGVAPDEYMDPPLPGVTEVTSKEEQRAALEQVMEGGEEQDNLKPRGPDGKFLKKAGADGEEQAGEEAKPTDEKADAASDTPAVEEKPKAEDDPDAPGYVFAKRKFKDQGHAEQVFDTMRGRAQKAEKFEAESKQWFTEREQAVALATQWKEYAENLQRGMTTAEAAGTAAAKGGQPTGTPSNPTPLPEGSNDVLSSEERKIVREVLRNPSAYGYESPEDALLDTSLLIATRIANARIGQTESKLEAISKPIEDSKKAQERLQSAKSLWSQFADHEEEGQLVFPELTQSAEFRDAVLDFWDKMGKPVDEHSIHYAILRVREKLARRPSAKTGTINLDDLLPPEIADTPRHQPSMHATTDAPRSLAPRRGGESDDIRRLKEGLLFAGTKKGGLPGVA
jgi:hypothetical protein